MARPGCGGCGGIGTCGEVMDCWCAQANRDQGLTCDDESRPAVKIGNCLVFGPDGEVSIDENCLAERPAGPCEARVDLLPDFIVGGSSGGSPLTHPMGSPQALDYVIDQNIDFAACHSFSLVGGVASWSPYDGLQEMDRYSIVPAGVTGFAAAVAEWTSATSDAGTNESPTGRNSGAPASYLDPDGGWYGFYAGQFQLMTAGDAIRLAGGQKVLRFDVRALNPFGGYTADVDAILRSIQRSCAQESSMVLVPFEAVDQVSKIDNAQVTPVVLITATGQDPAVITGAGGQWVEIEARLGNAEIQRFVDAGLQVIVSSASWQTDTLFYQSIGCRGIICGDPVYARGLLDPPETLGYRRITQTWIRRGTSVGELTAFTSQDLVLNARGWTKQSQGGKLFAINDTRSRYDQLMGTLCPLEDPTAYTLEVSLQVDGNELPVNGSNSMGPRAGLLFGFETDPQASQTHPSRDGYWAAVLVSSSTTGADPQGTLRIGKYVDGESTVLGSSATRQPVTANENIDLRLTVAGDQITWARVDGTEYEVSVTDGDYRGEYFAIHASKTNSSDGDFVCLFTDVSTVSTVDGQTTEQPVPVRFGPDDFDPDAAPWPPQPEM